MKFNGVLKAGQNKLTVGNKTGNSSGMNKGQNIIIVFMVTMLILACDMPWDPGPQPNYFDSNEFQPMLNVLGIIQPGTSNRLPLTFVHLEKSHAYLEFPDSLEVGDAKVELYLYHESSLIDTISLIYTDFGGIFLKPEYRHWQLETADSILGGQTYHISCIKSGYPELTSITTVPLVPVIQNDSVTINADQCEFTILRDTRVGLYDIYLERGEKVNYKRLLLPKTGNTEVKIPLENDSVKEGKLIIYAYDKKLSEYMTYNIIIKPQTYQSNYSTVHNGYGCFGSMNLLEKTLSF